MARNTFQQQVLDCLGRDICAGHYLPGQTLPSELELCERFGFSRIVIREAIKSLAAKGMVAVRRKFGTLVLDRSAWNLFDPDIIGWRAAVSGIDHDMSRDLMELRRIVEPVAARLAAERASDTEREAVRTSFETLKRAVNGETDYVAADLAFHRSILVACGNQFLCQMQNAISAILRTCFEIVSRKPGGPALSMPGHERLCLAIETGDTHKAEQAVLDLISQAESDLAEAMALGSVSSWPADVHDGRAKER